MSHIILSQFENTLSICNTYRVTYPGFDTIVTLLSPIDQATLIHKTKTFSSQLWKFLFFPSSPSLRNTIVWLISGIDRFLSDFLISSLRGSSLFGFLPPPRTSKPSIIWQVTNLSATVDPYLLALQANYYYPLTCLSIMTPDEMQVEHGSNGTHSLSQHLQPVQRFRTNKPR
jgi:hypothetical protein